MIIDSKNYSGKCSCGKEHHMTTRICIIDSGAMKNLNSYLEEYNLQGFSVAIYDENTYKATKDVHPQVSKEIILAPENLHADNHGVALAKEQLPKNCDFLIAIGSGTIHDITRYCAHELNIPFVSCPTAASVDGFCSSVAAMTWDGFKKTFEAASPDIVVADLDIISKAPMFLTNSGFGDMIGKFIALADWKIGHILSDEYFCKKIHDMTMDAVTSVINSTKEIKSGNISAFQNLIYGLLLSGLAMQLLGNSRCASGAEHHISHLIEMEPEGLPVKSDALHGEKVGVGTLLAASEYHRLKDNKDITFSDYPEISDEYIKNIFGERLCDSIISENEKNCAALITGELLSEKWNQICEVIESIPTSDELLQHYSLLGVKSSLSDIGVSDSKLTGLLEYSPLVRNRLTLMRIKKAITFM